MISLERSKAGFWLSPSLESPLCVTIAKARILSSETSFNGLRSSTAQTAGSNTHCVNFPSRFAEENQGCARMRQVRRADVRFSTGRLQRNESTSSKCWLHVMVQEYPVAILTPCNVFHPSSRCKMGPMATTWFNIVEPRRTGLYNCFFRQPFAARKPAYTIIIKTCLMIVVL